MKLVNRAKRLNTKQLRKGLYSVAKIACVSLRGTYVQVLDVPESYRLRGLCYPVTTIYKGQRSIEVNGYIELCVFQDTTRAKLLSTFAHELAHLDEWRESGITAPLAVGKAKKGWVVVDAGAHCFIEIRDEQEKRAEAFECNVMRKMNQEEK